MATTTTLTQFKNEETYETVNKRKDVDKSNRNLVGSFAFQSPGPLKKIRKKVVKKLG